MHGHRPEQGGECGRGMCPLLHEARKQNLVLMSLWYIPIIFNQIINLPSPSCMGAFVRKVYSIVMSGALKGEVCIHPSHPPGYGPA